MYYVERLIKKRSLLVVGLPESGKDTFCEFLQEFGISYISSSRYACDLFIFNHLKDKWGYKTKEECFQDRRNHRLLWKRMICDYNEQDKTRLTRGILQDYDCYNGLRDLDEFAQSRHLFDLVIWIDRKGCSSGVCDITKEMCDLIVPNNSTKAALKRRAKVVAELLKYEIKEVQV